MGGQAYLSLENSEDPFLHGIKFTAMPPSKRFREMEQLSGGEKVFDHCCTNLRFCACHRACTYEAAQFATMLRLHCIQVQSGTNRLKRTHVASIMAMMLQQVVTDATSAAAGS